MSSNHLFSLLGRLEELITKSPRLAGRAFLPIDEALEIIKKIRVTVPDEVKTAKELVKQKEAILGKAQEEADRLLSRSTKEAQRILSEHHLIKLAQEESNEIKAELIKQSSKWRRKPTGMYMRFWGGLKKTS